MADNSPENNGDTAAVEKVISSAQYKSISSFEDAMRLVEDTFGQEIYSAADLGDGFDLLPSKDKAQLLGVPLLVMSANFSRSKENVDPTTGEMREFVSLRIVTKDGRKLIVNDGSSGIAEQVRMMWNMVPGSKGKPIYGPKGLRVSEYNHPEHGPSKTFYLDTASA